MDRVLDVRQGELCWIVGTLYMDMPLKPDVLADVSRDHWISAPPVREKYLSPDGKDKVMIEDESGRLRLIGDMLNAEMLVTGCVIAVMGTENADGDFEVIDTRLPDLPAQPQRWSLEAKTQTERPISGKVAIVSGLGITGSSGDGLALELFMEWLLGEATSPSTQTNAAQICRLIIAGDSLSDPSLITEDAQPTAGKKTHTKKYGYDASAYNPIPTFQLDTFLSTLLPSLPITLLPGASDPANVSLPQQPLHPALFPHSRAYAEPQAPPQTKTLKQSAKPTPISHPFHSTTNPSYSTISGQLVLTTSGQPTSDISRYLLPSAYSSPLDLLEATLRWRIMAPTAPDTLWCYPYQAGDPFVMNDGRCPHLYIVGNQPAFGTRVVEGFGGQRVRCVSVPRFERTGEVVLVDLETLGVEVVRFAVHEGDVT